jgi:glycerol-3-phosphate dehydrogenase
VLHGGLRCLAKGRLRTAARAVEQREALLREVPGLVKPLRRTRLGLLLPSGGEQVLPDVGAACSDALGWDAARWERERAEYARLVQACYSLPAGTRTVRAAGSTSTVTGSGPTGSPSA